MAEIVEHKSLQDDTDEALARLAKEGDDQALTTLIIRYEPRVLLRAKAFARAELDVEDLFQEGMIALLKAIRNYRDDARGSFRTFATVCVNNKLSSAIAAHMRDKNAPMRGYVPLSETVEAVTFNVDPQAVVIQHEEADARNQQILNLLSLFERQVLQLYLSSYSYDEMAQKLKSSVKAVDNALQRVRRKLRSVFIPG
ncbi:MAG: sigma-70 family RNA polymerase sigma factor [Anaerotruncus sp.]|nr:sigma-70 family RNA polymerase sigma factor [Anaerotruncus sp.]